LQVFYKPKKLTNFNLFANDLMKKDIVTTEIIVKENKVSILWVGNVNYIS